MTLPVLYIDTPRYSYIRCQASQAWERGDFRLWMHRLLQLEFQVTYSLRPQAFPPIFYGESIVDQLDKVVQSMNT